MTKPRKPAPRTPATKAQRATAGSAKTGRTPPPGRRRATSRKTSAAFSVPPRTRLELDPDDMQRSLMRVLLSLAGFVRDLLERQTLRRLERKTLAPAEVERLGRALMQLERTIVDLARQFDLDPEELNLGLGPLGRLR